MESPWETWLSILVVCRVSEAGVGALHTESIDRLASLPIDTFQALEGTGPFSFLSRVGATDDGLPHGMIGCMKSLTAHSSQGEAERKCLPGGACIL